MTRRDCLAGGSAALGGLALAAAATLASGQPAAAAAPPPVRLSLNENPFGPSKFAVQAVRGQFGELCRYAGDDADALTRAIAAREDVSPDRIVLGEILDRLGLHLAMAGPAGGEFIYSTPGYTALVDAVAPGGSVVVGVPLDQRLENDLSAIAGKMTQSTRAVYLVNPHNPTGTVSEAAIFTSFVRNISRRATVIVDEAYLEFEPDFAARTVVGLTRAGENVVVFRTFGKIYGLAGLAMGYAVAPTALADSLRRAGIGNPETLDRLSLAAAAGSLRDADYVATVRTKVAAERDKWNRLFDSLGVRHPDSKGNFVFFHTGRPHQDVAKAFLDRGIDIGRAFPPFDQWARISIGLPRDNAMARAAAAELLR